MNRKGKVVMQENTLFVGAQTLHIRGAHPESGERKIKHDKKVI